MASGNRLTQVIENTQTADAPVGNYPFFRIGNGIASYGIGYNYMRCIQYTDGHETLSFMCDGLGFVVEGENISHLLDMLVAKMIARIIEGETLKVGGQEVKITAVIVEALEKE